METVPGLEGFAGIGGIIAAIIALFVYIRWGGLRLIGIGSG